VYNNRQWVFIFPLNRDHTYDKKYLQPTQKLRNVENNLIWFKNNNLNLKEFSK